jgi:hypothetical protein
MTNIYALRFQLDGTDQEVILNALNHGEAVRKAEDWFARKFHRPAPSFATKPLASIVIHGQEKETIPQPFANTIGLVSARF